ncbi:inositol monophosphatase [Rhizobiaceae bacterium BDR2-2]|uniref:Inositol monophosphatase n=1 Tax=Ectorhizobium quercum TaxID=2965071 RepID=A0AAE3N0R4_9HYPH|nr:inositol monophosphatase family protein [Ectorhizobium quercum]MCX8997827.1 inositol monophosphatase [Ectorhizobium quercum]
MTGIDIDTLANLLREAARAEILPRFRRLGEGDIRAKTEATDLVTEADEAAERMIRDEVARIAPDSLFVGEESVAADPALLERLAGTQKAVIVDPVDGTYNFASGIGAFGVMAAVVDKGETVAGIIYDPLGDDWLIAEKGSGAFLKRPDGSSVRLAVADPVPLADMVGMASTGFLPKEKKPGILANLAKVRYASSYRCAAVEYRAFVGGFAHYLMYNKLMPWDHLPGTLIAAEAGAYVARLDGSAYLPSHTDGGLLVTPDCESWEALRREVFTL